MTKAELQQMIQSAVETAVDQKISEIFGDPDQGLVVRKKVAEQLRRQQRAVKAGERGRPLPEIVRKLGLK